MNEGWNHHEYLVLFSQAECSGAMEKYKFAQYMPGYTLVGLRGWDEFIVANAAGSTYSLPTVPLEAKGVEPFDLTDSLVLEPDARFAGKIKWYLKPLIFGGDPEDKSNLTWVTHDQHAELVAWWNNQYKTLKAQTTNA